MGNEAEKVRAFMERYVPAEGAEVVVGLSGGADSVCLLVLLEEAAKSLPFSLRAVHIHHGLRESADRDEQFCRELCAEKGIPLTCEHVKAADFAREQGLGLEEAGHILRRRCFEKEAAGLAAETGKPVFTALAHHLEDQAETILFRMSRGTGLDGLCGMRKREGILIRPLLSFTREEIEQALLDRGQSWCEDETNMDPAFARNRIRLRIMPELEKVNSAAPAHLAALAGEAQALAAYLGEQTEEAYARCRLPDGSWNAEALRTLHPFLQRRVLHEILRQEGGAKDIGSVHVEALQALLSSGGSKDVSLPGGRCAKKVYGRLLIAAAGASKEPEQENILPCSADDYEIRTFPFDGNLGDIPRGPYTKWFDYAKIEKFPVFRTRAEGDRIGLLPDGRTKRIARCMIDAKIPAALRDLVVMPAVGSRILWLPGTGTDRNYYVDEKTRTVLEITLRRSEQRMEDENDREDHTAYQ